MLLPNECINNCIETYENQRTTKSQVIYIVVITTLIIIFALLPYIYIDIFIQGNGIVRPTIEKTEITSSVSELVDSVYVKEGQNIKKGDIILRFRTNNTDCKMNYQSERINDYQSHIEDLKYLSKGKEPMVFKSPICKQQFEYYKQKISEQKTTIEQAKREYLRNKNLYMMKVISDEEYEKSLYNYLSQKNELISFIRSQTNIWQSDLSSTINQLKEIYTDFKQEKKDREHYTIRSPISGTVDQFSGIYIGSNVQSGQTIAIVSPKSSLCIDVYVLPRDIGFIRIGMFVKIQVESFNYNEWGLLIGKVTNVSSDYMTDNKGNSFYKVKCELPKDYLILKNTGHKGFLKKGMTISAHFFVARRSIFNLLYQNADEWLNPTQYKKVTIKNYK